MEQNIKDTINGVIRKEDTELYLLHNKGIFFLPELAITYLIGKELVKNSMTIFNSQIEDWCSETRVVPELGPVDLLIQLRGEITLVFEFKVRCNVKGYISDINKLLKIEKLLGEKSKKHAMYFCALMDRYAGTEMNQNEVIISIENYFGNQIHRVVKKNHYFDYFTTKDHAIQFKDRTMSCVIGLWRVGKNKSPLF